ncbi:MAG: IgGFc-binding protein [Myxococcales bacterium]|nr:IgGFc-binding protein [Myxococcales bacterium]
MSGALIAWVAAVGSGSCTSTDVVARGSESGDAGGNPGGGGTGGSIVIDGGGGVGPGCKPCSDDFTRVLNCDGSVKEVCSGSLLCGAGTCMAPCDAATVNRSTVGCDYYAVTLAAYGSGFGGCFVVFIANTFKEPVHVQTTWGTTPIPMAVHAKIPKGSGLGISYAPYDPAVGIPPGEVAILFLANDPVPHGNWLPAAKCPVPAAIGLDAHVHFGLNISSGRGKAFHVTTDRPVVAYQMLPYQAAYAAGTGATLLLPTSAWDTNYIAVEALGAADFQGTPIPPTMAIVATTNGTTVKMLPKFAIKDGIDVPGVAANTVASYKLDAGDTIELIQSEDFTGSPIEADKPIGLFAGHMGLRIPNFVDWSDHAEQQIPPVRALGSEYAVVSYRDRVPGYAENRKHRLVGAVDGTQLSFDPPIANAPTVLSLGSAVELESDQPFVVKSQDAEHPFMVFTYMSGSGHIANQGGPAGYGDPEFLRVVPGLQYLSRYVFFTDPTYPETNLVVVRRKGKTGFAAVELDCAGVLSGWQALGAGQTYEYTRVDLSRHNFEAQGKCNNGRHEMTSNESFGLSVWGWGSPETRPGKSDACNTSEPDNSCDVSYAYPAGENIVPINSVYVPPIPK